MPFKVPQTHVHTTSVSLAPFESYKFEYKTSIWGLVQYIFKSDQLKNKRLYMYAA